MIRYLKITLVDGRRFILRVTRESPRLISGVEVDAEGDDVVPRGVDVAGRPYHERVIHVQRDLVRKIVEMRMSPKYATLEVVPRSEGSAKARLVSIVTDTATLAEAMFPGGGLSAYNEGYYEGTKIPIRKLTGREIVTVAGTTAGAKILSEESWIVDRFGPVGARQIKRLRDLASSKEHAR